MRLLTWKAWALIGVCVVLGAIMYGCGARAAPVTAGPPQRLPAGHPWPFTPKQARLVMLMDKGHPARSSDNRQLWALTADLTYRTHTGDTITVPKGMVTDLASVPRWVQGAVPSDGDYAQAALIHDGCYATRGGFLWKRKGSDFRGLHRPAPLTRAQCDDLLDQAMGDIGVPAWERWAIWSAVRVGGAAGFGR